MEVILLERVGRLGNIGDVVKVKEGFARNFLIPQKKALRATEENKKTFEARKDKLAAENARLRADAEKQAEGLKGLSLTLVRQASEDGKLYGSVNARDVADQLAEKGHKIDRKHVHLTSTIKNTGIYTAKVALHPEVIVDVAVQIVRNESDAEVAVDPSQLADSVRDEQSEAPDAQAQA